MLAVEAELMLIVCSLVLFILLLLCMCIEFEFCTEMVFCFSFFIVNCTKLDASIKGQSMSSIYVI